MGLFDVHAHLTHPKLVGQVDELVARARAAGLTTIISNGLNPSDNEAVAQLAARHSIIKPAFGFYPVDTVLPEMLAAGVEYPRDPGPLASGDEGVAWVAEHAPDAFAIGEIGLDGYWVPEAFWPRQEEIFRRLVQIAIDHQKVIIIHTRKREQRTFEILQELQPPKVMWHCFGAKVKLAERIVQTPGHYFSIPANVRRAESFARMIEKLPRERLLLETDCPYLSPDRSVDNEPSFVAGTVDYAAERWEMSRDDASACFAANFRGCFGIDP